MSHTVEHDEPRGDLRIVTIFIPSTYDDGHRCGYVGVPSTHPLHGIHYKDPCPNVTRADRDNLSVGDRGSLAIFTMTDTPTVSDMFDVHGSITYAGGDDYPVEHDGLWWFGFDCHHYRDDIYHWDERRVLYETRRFADQISNYSKEYIADRREP